MKLKAANLFIVGYPKSGTSALWKLLRQHPDVSNVKKEPYTLLQKFDSKRSVTHTRRLRSKWVAKLLYHRDFHRMQTRYYLDASPDYIYAPEMPALIKAVSPDAKVIICLREPLSYLRSLHEQWARMKIFEGVVTVKGDGRTRGGVPGDKRSLYFHQVRNFVEKIEKNNLKTIVFELFKQDNDGVMRDIFGFLQLTHVPVETSKSPSNYCLEVEKDFYESGKRHFRKDIGNLNALLRDERLIEQDLLQLWGY